jgi:hypothetical protein
MAGQEMPDASSAMGDVGRPGGCDGGSVTDRADAKEKTLGPLSEHQ